MRLKNTAHFTLSALLLGVAVGQFTGCAASRPVVVGVPRAVFRPADDPDIVTARDGHLYLAGQRYRFVGVNVYSLASFPPGSGKYYCGVAHSDRSVGEILDEVVAMGGNAIRLSAYQSFTLGGTDFSRLDFIVAEARRRGLRLVLTLENQWKDCTAGGYKLADWYASGFRRPYGGYRLSFVEYVRLVVSRYRDEPAVLMWQIMNEAESRTAWWWPRPQPLHTFAREISGVIRSLDQRHPICLGTTGSSLFGSGGKDYLALARLDGLDILEAHDYDDDRQPWPNKVRRPCETAKHVCKPFFIGEIGISSPPFSRRERARLIGRKMAAAWAADVDGLLIWSYRAGDGTNKDFDRFDPLAGIIRSFTSAHPVR